VTAFAEVILDEDRDARAAHRVAVRYMRDTSGLVALGDDEDDERAEDEGSAPRRGSQRPLGAATSATRAGGLGEGARQGAK
jgi:hypothetical protein